MLGRPCSIAHYKPGAAPIADFDLLLCMFGFVGPVRGVCVFVLGGGCAGWASLLAGDDQGSPPPFSPSALGGSAPEVD